MKQYSFNDVDLLIDGSAVDGFPSDATISATRNSPQHSTLVDARGKLAVVTSADLTGTISFPLLMTADWNDTLYAKAQLTHATGLSGNKSLWTPMQIQIVDKMGGTLVEATNCLILKQPDFTRTTTISANTWSIYCEVLNITSGTYSDIGD